MTALPAANTEILRNVAKAEAASLAAGMAVSSSPEALLLHIVTNTIYLDRLPGAR